MSDSNTHRILDASANRAAEGLRVIEDYVRFALDDATLTRMMKSTRHELATACQNLSNEDRTHARDTQQDVGTEITTHDETIRIDPWSVCLASFERTKQSLRSLEEFSKISSPELAAKFESLRYRLYTLEKAVSSTRDSNTRLNEVTLCVLVDGRKSADEFSTLAQKLINSGVGMIQLRDKELSDSELVKRARMLVTHVTNSEKPTRTLVIINDRPDIATAAGADGVHLGQDDLSVKDARTILGTQGLIGVSTHSTRDLYAAILEGANYLGAGPTFPSTTKSFTEFPGLNYLEQIAAETKLPIFAIGGINEQNLPEVLDTGITRVAVSSAVSDAANPEIAASKLLEIIRNTAAQKSELP